MTSGSAPGKKAGTFFRLQAATLEAMERRQMLSVATVNANTTVKTVNNQMLGINLAMWDGSISSSQTQSAITGASLEVVRMPGGSNTDSMWHFNVNNQSASELAMVKAMTTAGTIGLQSIDYGSGSPQEGAALFAYLTASPSNTTPIGNGQEWATTGSTSWTTANWQTAGYWATLRASSTLPAGYPSSLSFLLGGHAAPYNVPYWEVGNEIYGSWETDEHGKTGDTSLNGTAGKAHDPTTYVTFAKQFATLVSQIQAGDAAVGQTDSQVLIGVNADSSEFGSWITGVLAQCAVQNFTPGFISDHNYAQNAGGENDATLLASQAATSSHAWAVRQNYYEGILNANLGATKAATVQLMTTEWNSVSSSPGKQMTSLVNGLYVVDTIGALVQTNYTLSTYWDLWNSWNTTGNNSSSLYGWRMGGDQGVMGTGGPQSPPATGQYIKYPDYYAMQLVSEALHPGDTVVAASTDSSTFAVFAIKEASTGDLDLMVVNMNPSTDVTEQFNVAGFLPGPSAQEWQYGEMQDGETVNGVNYGQEFTTNGASALALSTASLSYDGVGAFSMTFPRYSMSVVQLVPDSAPVVSQAAFALNNPVTTTTDGLGASGSGGTGAATLTYTWSATSLPPGVVTSPSFNTNGKNGSSTTTAKFYAPGEYTLQVSIADANALAATSTVSVDVTTAGFVSSRTPNPVIVTAPVPLTPVAVGGGGTGIPVSSPVTAVPISTVTTGTSGIAGSTQTSSGSTVTVSVPTVSLPVTMTSVSAGTTATAAPTAVVLAPATVSDPPSPGPLSGSMPWGPGLQSLAGGNNWLWSWRAGHRWNA